MVIIALTHYGGAAIWLSLALYHTFPAATTPVIAHIVQPSVHPEQFKLLHITTVKSNSV